MTRPRHNRFQPVDGLVHTPIDNCTSRPNGPLPTLHAHLSSNCATHVPKVVVGHSVRSRSRQMLQSKCARCTASRFDRSRNSDSRVLLEIRWLHEFRDASGWFTGRSGRSRVLPVVSPHDDRTETGHTWCGTCRSKQVSNSLRIDGRSGVHEQGTRLRRQCQTANGKRTSQTA